MEKHEVLQRPEINIISFEERAIQDTIRQLNELSVIFPSNQPIIIDIDSYGGSIYGMSSLYEHLKTISNPILTYIS